MQNGNLCQEFDNPQDFLGKNYPLLKGFRWFTVYKLKFPEGTISHHFPAHQELGLSVLCVFCFFNVVRCTASITGRDSAYKELKNSKKMTN